MLTVADMDHLVSEALAKHRAAFVELVGQTLCKKIREGKDLEKYLVEEFENDPILFNPNPPKKAGRKPRVDGVKTGFQLYQTQTARELAAEGFGKWTACWSEAATRWSNLTQAERDSWRGNSDHTDKPPQINAYNYFKSIQNKEMRLDAPNSTRAERTEQIKRRWHALSREEKQNWKVCATNRDAGKPALAVIVPQPQPPEAATDPVSPITPATGVSDCESDNSTLSSLTLSNIDYESDANDFLSDGEEEVGVQLTLKQLDMKRKAKRCALEKKNAETKKAAQI